MTAKRLTIYMILLAFIGVSAPVSSSTSSNLENYELEEVYEGPKILVNVAARKLYLFDEDDDLVKVYPIAVGRSIYKTPIGERKMRKIVWNPWWIPPKSEWAKDDKPTPPGPHNPLGPVKMKLGGGIMFHGTNKPNSVGRAASHGCMRMKSEDAKELAWYLQSHMTDENDELLLEDYKARPRKSFHVNLETQIPVNIIYDTVEVKDRELHVYQDVYYRVRNKTSLIKEELLAAGYDLDDFDWDFINSEIRKSNNRKDLVFKVKELTVKFREKQERLAEKEKLQKVASR